MTHVILFTSAENPLRSMGVAKLATLLRERNLIVETIDFVDFWSTQDLENVFKKLCTLETIMIGTSCNFVARQKQREIIKFANKYAPNAKILAGGQAHTTRNENMGFDFIVTSYIDNAIDDIVSYLKTGNINNIRGVEQSVGESNCWYLDASKHYPSQNIKDLAPRYNHSDVLTSNDYLGIEFARGCRFRCKFCNYPFLGVKENTTVEGQEILKQFIDNYKNWGITNYIINDSTFNDRTEKVKLLADIVECLPFEVNFSAYIRIDLLVRFPEQVPLLKKARVWAHWYGTETFHPDAAKAIGKGMPSEHIKQGMIDTRKYFLNELGLYRGHSSLIAGLPYESSSSWESTEEWHLENFNDQSRCWFSLELPDTDAPEVEHSVFTKNLSKYGMRKMQDKERINSLKLEGYKSANYSMPWEHDSVDLLDAWIFKAKFDKNVLPNLPVNTFSIIPLTKFLDNRDLLSYTNKDHRIGSINNNIQHDYIKNKKKYLDI